MVAGMVWIIIGSTTLVDSQIQYLWQTLDIHVCMYVCMYKYIYIYIYYPWLVGFKARYLSHSAIKNKKQVQAIIPFFPYQSLFSSVTVALLGAVNPPQNISAIGTVG